MPFQVGHKFSGGARGGHATAARHATNKLISRSVTMVLAETDPKRQRQRAYCLALRMYDKAMEEGDVAAARFLAERHEGLPRQEVDVRSLDVTEAITSAMSVEKAASIYMDMIRQDEYFVDLSPGDYETVDTIDQVKVDQARAIQKVLSKPTPGGGATTRERRQPSPKSKLVAHADTAVATKRSDAKRRSEGRPLDNQHAKRRET
jgi:hypothetical protein